MSIPDSILSKIKALFRLADTTRCATRAEAELALQKAQELMVKWGLSKVDVEDTSDEAMANRSYNVHSREFRTGRPRYPVDQYIARIIIACFNVRVVWSWEWSRKEMKAKKGSRRAEGGQTTYSKMLKRLIYILVGEPEDTEFAKLAVEELTRMMRGLFDQYMREQYRRGFWAPKKADPPCLETQLQKEMAFEGTSVEEVRHSFLRGVETGFKDAANRGREAAYAEATRANVDAYAIVLSGKKEAIQKWMNSNMSLSKSRGTYGWRGSGGSGHAYQTGYKAGSTFKVGLRKLS